MEFDTSLAPVWDKSATPKPQTVVIDLHAHMAVPEAAELATRHLDPSKDPRIRYADPLSTRYNQFIQGALQGKLTDPSQRIADLDALGVDIQAVSIAPQQYYYGADPDLGLELARMANDRIAEVAAAHPDRLVAMGTLPLQAPELALAELRRIIDELGMKGLQFGTNVNGKDLDADELEPIWDTAEHHQLVVILHPHGFDEAARLSDYYLTNVLGLPLDSTIALTRLIHSGVLERHPDLRLVVVHGGGYLPYYIARSDHAWRHRPEPRARISRPPSEYLRRVHFDTTTHSSDAVRYLVEHYGAERVVLGTDYPYDMGVTDPVTLIAQAGLDEQQARLVYGGNAARLLNLQGAPQ